MLAAFLTTVLFSVSVVCGNRSARVMGGSEANFWRLAVATGLLGIWAHTFSSGLAGPAFPAFLLSGIIGVGIGDVGLFQALPRLGARLCLLLIQCFSAPFAALVEWIWLGTTLSAGQLICGVVILGGVVIALSPKEHLHLTRRELTIGVVFSLLGAMGHGFGAVLSRKAFSVAADAGQDISSGAAAYQRLVGGLFIAGVCLLIVKWRALRLQAAATPEMVRQVSREKWRRAWPWVLANGVAGQTLGVSCFQWALRSTPAGIVLPIIAITPLVAIPFTRYIDGERPSPRSLIGGLVAVGGAVGLALLR